MISSLKEFSIISFFFFSFSLNIFSQSSGTDKLLEMKNAFVVGLIDKGLEIGVELMSRNEYSSVREEATFYVAELFFLYALSTDESQIQVDYASKAYTYYLVLSNDYPNSNYITTISARISFLKTFFSEYLKFQNLLNPLLNESNIVADKLDFITGLYSFSHPNPYVYFLEGELDQSSVEVLSRYLDEVIINHPDFEIYAYNLKILAKLSTLVGIDFFKDGILEFDVEKISFKGSGYYSSKDLSKAQLLKNELLLILAELDVKYPHHPLLLNLHLIFAKIFMYKSGSLIDYATKKHLEFVVQNELDKTHPRYLLAKEFLLNNSFE